MNAKQVDVTDYYTGSIEPELHSLRQSSSKERLPTHNANRVSTKRNETQFDLDANLWRQKCHSLITGHGPQCDYET